MANTFDWIEIRTHDIERTGHFYESLFGWKIAAKETAGGSPVWLFDTGAEPRLDNLRRGGICLRPEGERLGIIVYVVVDDIDATLRRAVELGGKAISSRAAVGGGFVASLEDPSGNVLGLYEDRKE